VAAAAPRAPPRVRRASAGDARAAAAGAAAGMAAVGAEAARRRLAATAGGAAAAAAAAAPAAGASPAAELATASLLLAAALPLCRVDASRSMQAYSGVGLFIFGWAPYRGHAFYFRAADLVLQIVILLVAILVPLSPSTPGLTAARAVVTLTALAALAWALLEQLPYKANAEWKLRSRLTGLSLVAVNTLIALSVSSCSPPEGLVDVLSALLCVGLAAFLFIAFNLIARGKTSPSIWLAVDTAAADAQRYKATAAAAERILRIVGPPAKAAAADGARRRRTHSV
jgi:hypothetical protein